MTWIPTTNGEGYHHKSRTWKSMAKGWVSGCLTASEIYQNTSNLKEYFLLFFCWSYGCVCVSKLQIIAKKQWFHHQHGRHGHCLGPTCSGLPRSSHGSNQFRDQAPNFPKGTPQLLVDLGVPPWASPMGGPALTSISLSLLMYHLRGVGKNGWISHYRYGATRWKSPAIEIWLW